MIGPREITLICRSQIEPCGLCMLRFAFGIHTHTHTHTLRAGNQGHHYALAQRQSHTHTHRWYSVLRGGGGLRRVHARPRDTNAKLRGAALTSLRVSNPHTCACWRTLATPVLNSPDRWGTGQKRCLACARRANAPPKTKHIVPCNNFGVRRGPPPPPPLGVGSRPGSAPVNKALQNPKHTCSQHAMGTAIFLLT